MRWLSLGWLQQTSGWRTEPLKQLHIAMQTPNLYSFVSDNPESFAEMDGHMGPNSYSHTPWVKHRYDSS